MSSLNGSIQHHSLPARDEKALDGTFSIDSGDRIERASLAAQRLVGSDPILVDYAALDARWIGRILANDARVRNVDQECPWHDDQPDPVSNATTDLTHTQPKQKELSIPSWLRFLLRPGVRNEPERLERVD